MTLATVPMTLSYFKPWTDRDGLRVMVVSRAPQSACIRIAGVRRGGTDEPAGIGRYVQVRRQTR
eukprot:scaffold128_cov118-Isochrysis_galbana.AAC.1